MALDGDTNNLTFSDIFKNEHPNRFVECYIAQQNMVLLLSFSRLLFWDQLVVFRDLGGVIYGTVRWLFLI